MEFDASARQAGQQTGGGHSPTQFSLLAKSGNWLFAKQERAIVPNRRGAASEAVPFSRPKYGIILAVRGRTPRRRDRVAGRILIIRWRWSGMMANGEISSQQRHFLWKPRMTAANARVTAFSTRPRSPISENGASPAGAGEGAVLMRWP